ncbi:MAG: VanZ family protein [Prevotella sp.]|jgi:VanZ family protein
MAFGCKLLRIYPISISFIIIIWVICLIPIPETPLSHVSLIDKWTHVALYALLCVSLWSEYGWRSPERKFRYVLFWFFLIPLLMGGAIEIVQATCTGGRRSGDWIDFAADGVGVLLGQIIGIPLARVLSKRNKAR